LGLVKGTGRAALLGKLAEFPGRQFTIRELAIAAGVPYASAWLAVRDWMEAGVVSFSRVGKATVVALRSAAYARKLLGAVAVPSVQSEAAAWLGKKLGKEKGVSRAVVFGSVAEGREKWESDLDLAVVAKDKKVVERAVFAAFDKWGAKTIPLFFENEKAMEKFLEGKKTRALK